MITTLAEVLRSAEAGNLAEVVLIPLSRQGKLRISYEWLYSALNCDPTDDSDFVWVLTKLADRHVTLSPRDRYRDRQLYASVRDDWDWHVQVQAPHSADWITAAARNETLLVEGADLLTVSLRGWNEQYLTVDAALSEHDGHAGYRLRAVGGDRPARTFFVGVTRQLQAGLPLPLRSELDADLISRSIGAAEPGLADYLRTALG